MLRTLTARHDSFALKTPFRISRGVKIAADVVSVEIGEGAVRGHGEGVPYPRYGESVEAAITAIELARDAIEGGADRADLLQFMPPGAARNAVDCALWDLEAKAQGTSAATLAGRPPVAPTETALTVGLDTPAAMAEAAKALRAMPLIKIKVDRTDPAAQIRAVRNAAPAARLIVDPNESWTIDDVDALQSLMIELRIDLLEQPLPAEEDDALAGYRSAIPIAADESAHVAGDLDRLADLYQVINIKLDKTGGLTAALRLADEAQARGMGLMVGCMICSSLSIAPAMLLAQGASFVDLDGPLWLSHDRAHGVTSTDGMLIPAAPGFWG